MACVYDIAAYGDASSDVPAVLEKALDEVDRIDRLMSHYKPQSPLSQLNRDAAAGAVVVDQELFDFIARSLDYSRDSDGAFDITVGPLMKAWGFFKGDGRVPADAELRDVMRRVGYRHVVLDRSARTIRFDAPGVELDLGGIAKGYAVDRVVALLQQHGITAALVSAGGSTVYGLGHPPDRASWDVKIQDPLDPTKVALSVGLRDRALSMAGRSAKTFEANGVRLLAHHGPADGPPRAGHRERRGHVADGHGRRCPGRCAVRDGRGREPEVPEATPRCRGVVLAAGARAAPGSCGFENDGHRSLQQPDETRILHEFWHW